MNKKVELIINLAEEKKAEDIEVIDVKGICIITDKMVICNGDGSLHTRTIAKYIIEETKKMGIRLHHQEGLDHGSWILLDYSDVLVHIFEKKIRTYYKLGKLWKDIKKEKDSISI